MDGEDTCTVRLLRPPSPDEPRPSKRRFRLYGTGAGRWCRNSPAGRLEHGYRFGPESYYLFAEINDHSYDQTTGAPAIRRSGPTRLIRF